MRPISAQLLDRLLSSQQTAANNADPAAVVWIRRPSSPLTGPDFFEKTLIGEFSNLTACDVAVRRRRAGREPDEVFVAYVADGVALVKKSAVQADVDDFAWTDAGFSAEAEDVAICFDGKTVRSEGRTEWITDERPFVFTVHDGVLTARILGLLGETELASSNCTKVTAVRATSGGGVDFGLIVFFLLSGQIYYRQRIAGEWTDAAPVTFGPSGVTWADVAAFRTWDYRVGLQGLTTSGDVYELFTAFQGIAKHGAEHVSLDAKVRSALIPVGERPTQEPEHLSIGVTAAQGPYGGFYRTGAAQIAEAANADDGTGDFGKRAFFRFDRHLSAASVAADPGAFRIVDALGNVFAAQTAALDPNDGLTVRLTFTNFNAASGVCSAAYVPGTVRSLADVPLEATSLSFTPTGLVPPGVSLPELSYITNAGADKIVLTFDRALTGALAGAEAHFSVALSVYTFVPGGVLEAAERPVAAVTSENNVTLLLSLTPGNRTDLQPAVGAVTVTYDGLGPLSGEGGPVQAFSETFTPAAVTWKPDVAELEHLSLGLTAAGTLTQITNRLTQDPEHIELTVTAAGTLTHVNDL